MKKIDQRLYSMLNYTETRINKFYKKKDVKKNYVNIAIVHFEEMDFEPIPRQQLA